MTLDRIYEWAHQDPTRPAVVWNGTAVSYGEFARGVAATRKALLGLNLPAGSVAVIIVRHLLDAWAFGLALRSLGLDTIGFMSLDEARAMKLQGVSCVVADQEDCRRLALGHGPWSGARLIEHGAGRWHEFQAGPLPQLPAEGSAEGGHILYTSGTTGTYKKVRVDAAQLQESSAMRAERQGLTGECRWHLLDLGMWTAIGCQIPLSVWHVGGCVLFEQRNDWATRVLAQGMTHAMLLPRMVADLLQAADRMPSLPRPDHWRLTVTGGFLPTHVVKDVLERLTDNLAILYGATELSLSAMVVEVKHPEDMYWMLPAAGRTIEIVDEQGRPCPVGVEGHLRVRLLPLDASGYLDDPEVSARFFRDGCFQPGDMAIRREDGRIRVAGRSADVLNFQGQKRAAGPIEQQLQAWLGGRGVCLFSGINPAGQEEITVAVESERPFNQDEMRDLASRLTSFEQVRIVVCRKFPLTRTGTQKVDRVALKKLLFPGS